MDKQHINPMSLLGARRIFVAKEVKDRPIIAVGKKYLFHDVVEVNIRKLEFMSMKQPGSDKEVPGMMINFEEPDQLFVTMDDDSLYINREFCVALAKGWNSQKLNEIIESREEAQRAYVENDEAAKKLGKIIEVMK